MARGPLVSVARSYGRSQIASAVFIGNYRHQSLTCLIGHALRKNAAGAFGPDLAKKLTQLVKMEKNVMRSLEQVAKERMDVAVSSQEY